MTQKTIFVTCPNCQKTFNYYSSEYRPFCCERCRLVDLGQWLDEGYRIPVQGAEIEDEEKAIDEEGNKTNEEE